MINESMQNYDRSAMVTELTLRRHLHQLHVHRVHRWLGSPVPHLNQVWAGQIKWSQWSNSDHRPIDLNAQTYPVRWLPYIADLKAWRTYDPSKIDGVGELVGMMDGKNWSANS